MKTGLEKVSFDRYEWLLWIFPLCYFLSLAKFETFQIRKKEIPLWEPEADTVPKTRNPVSGGFSRARGQLNWSLGPCSQGRALVWPREQVYLPSSALSPRARPPTSGAGSEQRQPRWWFYTQQGQQFAAEIIGDSTIQEPCPFPPPIVTCSIPASISKGGTWWQKYCRP